MAAPTGQTLSSNIAHAFERQCSGGTRGSSLESITVDTVLADSEAFDFSRYTQGEFTVPTGSSLTTLTFHSSNKEGGTYIQRYKIADNSALTATVQATRRYQFPPELAGAAWVKITGNADGAITDVVLKS